MTYVITVEMGEDLELEQVVNVEGVDDPITGASCWFAVKRDWMDPDDTAILFKSTEDGTVLGDTANSRFTCRISHDDYSKFTDADVGVAFPFGVKYQAAGENAQTTTLRKGKFRVKAPIIRAVRPE